MAGAVFAEGGVSHFVAGAVFREISGDSPRRSVLFFNQDRDE